MNRHTETLLEEYRKKHTVYERLEEMVSRLLREEMDRSQIMIFQLSGRLKTEESLAGKLEKKGDKYAEILDITELLGMRVICYFADDVDRIAERIEGLFIIDRENTVDKRKILEDDRFGYMSLHYICMLSAEQCEDEEMRSIRFEIQIRSVLQHAWAEINHDIGYKSTAGVPRSIIREFSRIAGLLEIADDEFEKIRDSISSYRLKSEEDIKTQALDDIPVNEVTLRAYLENDKAVQDFIRAKGTVLDLQLSDDSTERLEAMDVTTVQQFAKLVSELLEKAWELHVYENDGSPQQVSAGALIRHLAEAKLISSSEEDVHNYMMRFYKEEKTAERREKDLEKYAKRYRKGKPAKKKSSAA